MSLDWSNERYVRLYTRDTDEWLVLPWQARATWPLLLRKVDRSGVLPAKLGPRGVAVMIGLPVEVVAPGIEALLEDGCLVSIAGGYLVPNFIEAQEASSSDAQRKRDSRERRRASALGHLVTNRDQPVTNCDQESQPVTSGHDLSQAVTPCCAEPSRAEPDLVGVARARDPAVPVPAPAPAAPPAQPQSGGQFGKLLEHAIRRLDAARRELDPKARPIGSALTLSATARDQLLGKLRAIDEREREATLDHCLDVLIAAARTKGDVGMLRVGMLAGESSWDRWRLATVTSVSAPQRAPPPPARQVTTGRYEPPDPSSYQDGEIPL